MNLQGVRFDRLVLTIVSQEIKILKHALHATKEARIVELQAHMNVAFPSVTNKL